MGANKIGLHAINKMIQKHCFQIMKICGSAWAVLFSSQESCRDTITEAVKEALELSLVWSWIQLNFNLVDSNDCLFFKSHATLTRCWMKLESAKQGGVSGKRSIKCHWSKRDTENFVLLEMRPNKTYPSCEEAKSLLLINMYFSLLFRFVSQTDTNKTLVH